MSFVYADPTSYEETSAENPFTGVNPRTPRWASEADYSCQDDIRFRGIFSIGKISGVWKIGHRVAKMCY